MDLSDSPKIIIAEDDLTLRIALAEVLAKRNLNIIGTAENGIEVISLLKTKPANLVLMDIRMPQMDGIETTEYITQHYPKVKVLVLSTYDEEGYVQLAIKAGAQGYLLKIQTLTM